MDQHRRGFLTATAAALSLNSQQPALAETLPQWGRENRDCYALRQEILDLFSDFPDRLAFKIWAPPIKNGPEFLVQRNERGRMFAASTNKSFILCERLRQLDSPEIEKRLVDHKLRLDDSIWSPGSTIFDPPNLSGRVSERTAMEAMVVHSDNTGTDIVLKEAGAQRVRTFIASIGMRNTMIPDSTRTFGAYVVGAPNYKTITWEELITYPPNLVHPLLNDVETFASSSDDLVSLFSRALPGRFFSHRETLEEFRRILALGDINYLVRFPLGMSVFGKAGYADGPGTHARSIAGGVYFPDRWVYFSMILNWDAAEAEDPRTVERFYGAIRRSMALLQEKLGD
jgi:beta-lactamase class A